MLLFPRGYIRDTETTLATGQQLLASIQGVGEGLAGHTCDGPLPEDATFTVGFNYENADTR